MLQNEKAHEEYVTIFAPSAADAMAEYWARGLDREGYLIASRIGRHQICTTQGAEVFAGTGLVAATFSRRVSA